MTSAQTYLALAVQHFLADKGMSQAEFAARIGARPSDLSRRLAGDRPFEDRDVPRLAAGLGVTPRELIDKAKALGWQSTQSAVRAKIQQIRDGD
ncbi:helix-turn-helix domain-containing protein [Actinotalea fermentans]|uniref:HTH cro/C1-type domain-containing protein n=1 Tax=Actinotalea fermentans TaxID=43671 RepID=A0A511YU40_9CELL|nr:hypothetical protein N867_09200 [Actinotalea fermentans ATCC 43279 = JCM 9966 = DSM 3133]GEN78713.1 hypothetical protein AFE02nite_04470 [Actinotalea fermentans]